MSRRSILFSLWALQGLAALVWLALLPTDAEHGLIGGFSASRLVLMGIALALTVVSGILAWISLNNFAPFVSFMDKQAYPLFLVSVITTFSSPAAILILRELGKTSGFAYTAYAERLAPLAAWLALSAVEFAILERKAPQDTTRSAQHLLRSMYYVFTCIGLITIFIIVTRIGLTRLNAGSWGEPTTPLLEWQILLALIVSLAALSIHHPKAMLSDSKIAILVYLFTCVLWTSQPIHPGYFATPPRAPNFEIYPFSDALIYAQYAQSALVGNGFLWPDVPTRPLYITFITWLHVLVGQDYTRIIFVQTLALAAFPAVLYLLGKELAGRPFGLGLALLAAFRDLTANVAAPFALNYTYTKLFFSEIPAALLISLFTLLAMRWMKTEKPAWYPLLAGGILGLSSLIRLQSAVVLTAVIPISFFMIKSRKKWLAGAALMILGVALALIPWLARNYRAAGGLVLDNPISQSMVLARRWSGDNGNALIPHLPGENDAQYSSRMGQIALQSLKADPGHILGAAVNHFFNNEISNLLVFPLRDQLNDPGELIWPDHAFWQTWNGQPGPGQTAVIAFYLILLGLGLTTAWHQNRLLGLLPLALTIVYNAWTALFLSSGDRFLVPVDWAIYLYLFLGLLTLASWVINGWDNGLDSGRTPLNGAGQGGETDNGADNGLSGEMGKRKMPWRGVLLTAALSLLAGASLPLTELAFPRLYPPANAPQTPGTEVVLHGRAIYPRWYDAGEGEPGTAKMGYGESDEARLVFFLVGEANTLVVYPLEKAPKSFPNAVDVTVTGVWEDGFVQAQKIEGKSVVYLP